jgi:hypothetical protein
VPLNGLLVADSPQVHLHFVVGDTEALDAGTQQIRKNRQSLRQLSLKIDLLRSSSHRLVLERSHFLLMQSIRYHGW